MAQKRDPLPRVRDAWSWLGGIAVLGLTLAGVTGAAVVLWENIDVRRIAPELGGPPVMADDPEPPRRATRDTVRFDAVLFDSPRNRDFYPNPDFYPDALDAWQSAVGTLGGSARRVSSLDGLLGVRPEEVLVVPEAACLSDEEVDAIQAHLASGGGMLASGALGARDAECSRDVRDDSGGTPPLSRAQSRDENRTPSGLVDRTAERRPQSLLVERGAQSDPRERR